MNTTYENLAASPQGRDLAVVMFSGHGAIIDGRYYLLPHDVDARTLSEITNSALSVEELKAKLFKLAERARVLVLLDACHAGAVSGDGTALGADAKALRIVLDATNITVLASSDGTEVSARRPSLGERGLHQGLAEGTGQRGRHQPQWAD